MPSYSTDPTTASETASESVAIEDLVSETSCQARASSEPDPETLAEYQRLYQSPNELPPIEVFDVAGKLHVVDGHHRVAAAMRAGRAFIRCVVVATGTLEEAGWYATSVNQTHGLRRTSADKRHAVRLALENPIGQEQSNRTIAEHVGVGPELVAKVRKEWEAEQRQLPSSDSGGLAARCTNRSPDEEPRRRVGKDGKSYPVKAAPKTTATPIPETNEGLKKAASAVQRARREVRKAIGNVQAVDGPLEEVWRDLDGRIVVVCEQCGGSGCKWCESRGWSTKSQARATQYRLKSLQRGREARGLA